MAKYDLTTVCAQIQQLLDGQPISTEDTGGDAQAQDIQEALVYIGSCMQEMKRFVGSLAKGDLDVAPPSKYNIFVGEMKELHSGLMHLTWQASQVAKGDYHQRVDFMGEFSKSFNRMVEQLEEREQALETEADILSQSMQLLESVVDNLEEWLIVVEETSGEIIYLNNSAQRELVFLNPTIPECAKGCGIMERLLHYTGKGGAARNEIYCSEKGRILSVNSFYIVWKSKGAYAHLIVDVTAEKHMASLAYKDELTGLNNRWFGQKILEEMIEAKKVFTLCFIDMDGLKFVNDHFGHKSGDEYLLCMASCLKRNARDGDYLCRIGGDEFLWIIPDVALDVAEQKVLQISEEFRKTDGAYQKSFSYGLIRADQQNTLTSSQLLDQADQRMYANKRTNKKERR